jgi:hypothetical protein
LHHYLAAHPEISMSSIKELNFFSDPAVWDNGVDWYTEQFDADLHVRGESSTEYTRDHNAPTASRRASELLSQPKLIYLVRDPIERIRSDYHHHRAKGRELRPLGEAVLAPDNPYLRASSYGTQLSPFVERFGSERILVETQERLLADRRGVLKEVFAFLDVADDFYLPEFDRRWEQSVGKGWLFSIGTKVRDRGIRMPKALRWSAQRLQRSAIGGGAGEDARPPEIDPKVREDLSDRLRPELARLRELTGRSFDEWSL